MFTNKGFKLLIFSLLYLLFAIILFFSLIGKPNKKDNDVLNQIDASIQKREKNIENLKDNAFLRGENINELLREIKKHERLINLKTQTYLKIDEYKQLEQENSGMINTQKIASFVIISIFFLISLSFFRKEGFSFIGYHFGVLGIICILLFIYFGNPSFERRVEILIHNYERNVENISPISESGKYDTYQYLIKNNKIILEEIKYVDSLENILMKNILKRDNERINTKYTKLYYDIIDMFFVNNNNKEGSSETVSINDINDEDNDESKSIGNSTSKQTIIEGMDGITYVKINLK